MATRPAPRRSGRPKILCASGKRAYPDQRNAQKVLGRIWSTCKPGRVLECRAYHCGHCGQWHLTSMPLATSV